MRDNKIKSPFMVPRKAQSKMKMKMNRPNGRNNMTIEAGLRSQSPHLYSPMIQIKYETNNHFTNGIKIFKLLIVYQQPKSPQNNPRMATFQQFTSNQQDPAPNLGIYVNRKDPNVSGFMSPPAPVQRNMNDQFFTNMMRVASPSNQNYKIPERKERRRSNSNKMKNNAWRGDAVKSPKQAKLKNPKLGKGIANQKMKIRTSSIFKKQNVSHIKPNAANK